MREIKFRGKSVYSGEWLYGSLMINNEQFLISPIPYEPIHIYDDKDQNVIPETVGQFIGLHDKMGSDIYEGDFVSYYKVKDDRIDQSEPPIYWFERQLELVKFNNGMFCIDNVPLDWIGLQSFSQLESEFGLKNVDGYGRKIYKSVLGLSIVGNIHDNPEDF